MSLEADVRGNKLQVSAKIALTGLFLLYSNIAQTSALLCEADVNVLEPKDRFWLSVDLKNNQ